MTSFDALNQLTDIDPAFIADAEVTPKARRFPVRLVAVLAACFVLMATAGSVVAFYERPELPLVTDYDSCIKVSYGDKVKAGTAETGIEVQLALAEHKDENVLFWVMLRVFSEDGCINDDKAAIAEECDRLTALGYDVYVLGGTVHLKLTAEEIHNFQADGACEQYGYLILPGRISPEEFE